jgi:hypothetical protein
LNDDEITAMCNIDASEAETYAPKVGTYAQMPHALQEHGAQLTEEQMLTLAKAADRQRKSR